MVTLRVYVCPASTVVWIFVRSSYPLDPLPVVWLIVLKETLVIPKPQHQLIVAGVQNCALEWIAKIMVSVAARMDLMISYLGSKIGFSIRGPRNLGTHLPFRIALNFWSAITRVRINEIQTGVK